MAKRSSGSALGKGRGAMAKRGQWAAGLKVYEGQPMQKSRKSDTRVRPFRADEEGEKVWHGMSATQGAHPIPPGLAKGPERARAVRKAKGIDGY